MLTTTNYGLKKPEGTDVVNIDDFNGNADIIDTKLKEINSALPLKAPLDSPGLTGAPTAPTQTAGDNSTKIANTAFVTTAVANKTSVSGNAGTATKLQTPRNIALAGDVTGSANFDGSGNISITATVADDSHNHIIANVDGLQSALDSIDTHLSELTNDRIYYCGTTSGTNTYTAANNKIAAYTEGLTVRVKIGNASTGASTLNINGLGAKPILDSLGNAISGGGLKSGLPYQLCYNGTNFIVLGKGGGGDAIAEQILNGKKVTVDSGQIVGTMPERGNITASLNAGESYIVPEGHHDGGGKVTANSLASQTPANATSAQIVAGFSAWVYGNKIDGSAKGLKTASGQLTYDISSSHAIKFTLPTQSFNVIAWIAYDSTGSSNDRSIFGILDLNISTKNIGSTTYFTTYNTSNIDLYSWSGKVYWEAIGY